ncbi:MAG: response regulator [Deltaproteobacteria bacterium]|nr:response regulator [Deltaproteobacteria bacterium]
MHEKILVVDDDKLNAALMREICENAGYVVVEVHEGAKAVDLVCKEMPDLVLLDIMMSVKDGFEVCAEIKSNPETARIPVIMVTAIGDLDSKIRCMELGADDYITKPFRMFDLQARVRTVMDSRLPKRAAGEKSSSSRGPGHVGGFRLLRVDLDYEFKRARRYGHELTCAMVRIDGYDELFRTERVREAMDIINTVASALVENLREVDRIYRIDDDVFVLVMPETDRLSAQVPLGRIRQILSQQIGSRSALTTHEASFPEQEFETSQDMLRELTGKLGK